jgi:hypothetical protein
MNKRIWELADQCQEYRSGFDGQEDWHTVFNKQKFAELIVKEMCGMMEQTEDDLYAMDPSERPTEYIEWLYYWRTRFEQHFGVEE